MNQARPREDHYVQSLERGLSVITVFGPDSPELTLSDVSRAAGLTRAAARRFLLTLVDLGYMRFDGKLFRLAPRVLDLGYAYLSSLSLPGIAEPHLEWLVGQTRESSSMSVLDGNDIVYVARVPTSRIMTVSINVGTRFPAYATSMGRVLLAGLDDPALERYLATVELEPLTEHTVRSADELHADLLEVRSQGYALVDQELEHGLRSLAVPVRSKQGRVVAAVNVSSHVSRITKEKARRQFLPPLLKAAAEIESDLART
ncbi:MAG TPA: IclR family transcriptional regulator C-terminal domain-containing protein [Nocardioidaceae bacterium]|nr:IclR family transcriptional regulator C-terminal domain-containing protein [Nocardioidaceae bacterium]